MEAATPKVSIIIPHYNQVEYLKRLLPSVANQTFQDYEVIIIDDFTPDRSAPGQIQELIKNYPRMRLVENTKNVCFVKTINKGISLSNGEYICLLNQDTEIKSNFVERNVEILDSNASIGALSCTIVDGYGKNWWSGGSFKAGFPMNSKDDFEGIRPVDFVAGTAAFYRREVFNEIGLFDESFGMYHEDVEFGLRIKAETSYRACVFSDKLVIHYHLGSMPGREPYYLLKRNHMLLVRKYCPRLLPIVLLRYSLSTVLVLTKDVLGLHPWLLFLDAVSIRGIFAGLVKKAAKAPRLDER